jgi:hypothetical protein
MDKAISRLPELSYLLFIDRMGLFYDIRDNCLQIEPFLRDVRIRDALRNLHFSDVSDDDQDRLIWGPTSLALAEILTMPREVTIFSTIFICAANGERLFPLIIKHLKQMRETNASLFIPFEVIEIGDCGYDHYLYMSDELILEFFHLMKELSQGKCNLGQSLCCSKCQYIEFDRMSRKLFLSVREWRKMPCSICNANINTDIFCNECINPCSCYIPYRDGYYSDSGDIWWEEGCKSLICNDCLEKTNEGENWTSPRCIERAREEAEYEREEAEFEREEAERAKEEEAEFEREEAEAKRKRLVREQRKKEATERAKEEAEADYYFSFFKITKTFDLA